MRLWQFLLTLLGLAILFAAALVSFNMLLMPRLVHRHGEVRVPDLLDAPLVDARETASALGLELEVVREDAHPSAPVGDIIDQHPGAGAVVRSGRRVAVVLSGGPPAGPVPSVAGLTLRQAEATLQRESYKLGRVLSLRSDDAITTGVGWQSPASGTPLRKGETVDLVLAEPRSTPPLLVPDLRGRSLFTVRASLEAAGCVLAPPRYRRDGRVPPGTVLEQDPDPGSRIPKGGTIELVASTR